MDNHNTRVVDYLYGEMTTHDKHQFEQELKADPKLQAELEGLRELQTVMRADRDESPTGAVHLYDKKPGPRIDARWWMIAASMLVLLIAGKALDLKLEMGNGQVALQFGDGPEEQQLDRQEVLRLMAGEFDAYQRQMDSRLQQIDSKLSQNLQTQDDPAWENHFADYRAEFSELQQDLRKDQTIRYGQFMDQMQRDRRNYSRELMEDLFLYVEQQRRQDLEAINQGFLQLSQAIQGDNGATRFVNQPLKKY